MAISVIATGKNGVRANSQTTGITVTHGFTLANDDVLYAFLTQGDDLPVSGGAWSSSSGGTWVELKNQRTTTGNDHFDGVMRRVVTDAGAEPSTFTFTLNNSNTNNLVCIVVQVRGADTTTPEDATTTSSLGSDDFTPPNVAITTVTDAAHVIISHVAIGASTTINSSKTGGAPSGWTLEDTVEGDNPGGINDELFLEVASLVKATAGVVTPGDWTGTADDATSEYGTFAVAVRPATATANPKGPLGMPLNGPFGGPI